MLVVVFVIISKIDERQDSNKLSEPDNPLLLTIQAMETELSELKENNIHMERIAQLEKDIEEANKHAGALSKVAGNYGNTIEEVGESIVGSVGGRDAVHTITPVNSNGIVVGGILSKGLDADIKNTIHEALDDAKPDWEGYTNSLLNKDHNLISYTKGSIYQGDHKDIQGLLDYIEEELRLTGDTCLRFGSRTRFFSIMILLHNLSLDEFKSKVSYWDKSYAVLLANKESYGVKRKLFEQEVFNFEEFRQAVLSYFKEKEDEPSHTILLGQIIQELEKDEQTRKEDWFKKEQDKAIREIEEQLRELDKSIHKAECGKWNTIPKALSHEERVSITMEKLNTKRMKEGY